MSLSGDIMRNHVPAPLQTRTLSGQYLCMCVGVKLGLSVGEEDRLRLFENRMLGKMSGNKGVGVR